MKNFQMIIFVVSLINNKHLFYCDMIRDSQYLFFLKNTKKWLLKWLLIPTSSILVQLVQDDQYSFFLKYMKYEFPYEYNLIRISSILVQIVWDNQYWLLVWLKDTFHAFYSNTVENNNSFFVTIKTKDLVITSIACAFQNINRCYNQKKKRYPDYRIKKVTHKIQIF